MSFIKPAADPDVVGETLIRVGGVLLYGAILAGPWMFGGTREWAVIILAAILSVAVGLWGSGYLIARRVPSCPPELWMGCLWLVSSGWLVTYFRPAPPADAFTAWHLSVAASKSPGDFLLFSRGVSTWFFSAVLLSAVMVANLASDQRRRANLLVVIAISGASVILEGLIQIVANAPGPLWDKGNSVSGYFFGPFFHRTFGGTFVNLVWPISAALVLSGSGETTIRLRRWLGSAGSLVLLLIGIAGVFVQTSRFAYVCAGGIAAALFGWLLWRLPAGQVVRKATVPCLVLALSGFTLLAVTKSSPRVSGIGERWEGLWREIVDPAPLQTLRPEPGFQVRPDGFIETTDPMAARILGTQRLAWATCISMLPDAGLLGFGAGTWSLAYPHYTDDPLLRSFPLYMQFAHNDHLQFAVEHGLWGAVVYLGIILGALVKGVRSLRQAKRIGGIPLLAETGMVAALLGVSAVMAHGIFDFPLQIPSVALYFWVFVGLLWSGRDQPAITGPVATSAS